MLLSFLNQRLEDLRSTNLFLETKALASYKTDALTAKMWIDPNGKAIPISEWHYRWFLKNADKYGLDVSQLPDSEEPVRIFALRKGFFRVNYEHRRASLTIEGCRKHLSREVKDAIFVIVMDNLSSIDRIRVTLFNDDVTAVVASKGGEIFSYRTDDEKIEAIDDILREGVISEGAGLSRIVKHMAEHDCGTITAWRNARECNRGEPYTRREKDARNRSLLSKLKDKRYGIIGGKGAYIETTRDTDGKVHETEVHEDVFFVVDLNDSGELLNDLKKWGEEFEQDSILYIPKGESGQLHTTNDCDADSPKGSSFSFDFRVLGHANGFFTRINGRPYSFTFRKDLDGNLSEELLPEGFMGRWANHAHASVSWDKA